MGYRLSRAAEDDIIALYLDGVRQFGAAQADLYLTELEHVPISGGPSLRRP